MAAFIYQALTTSGRLMKGTLEASSRQQASELLQEMKLAVNSVEEAPPEKAQTAIGRNEFLLFNQQLATITQAGIPLERGLRELAADVGSRKMQKLVNEIADELEGGAEIEQAFAKRHKDLPPFYSQIVRAGVKTGRLSEMLMSMNRHLEMMGQTRRVLFEAMCYPLIVLALAAVIVTSVFLIIIPQYRLIFEGFDTALPRLTLLMLYMSDHVIKFWMGVGCVIGFGFFLKVILSHSAEGRRFKESLFLRIPILGRLYRYSVLSRMADAMAVLVGAGCDIPESLRMAANTTGSENIKRESELLAAQIEQGANFMEAGQLCSMIPKMLLYSIQLGTQRNELQDNLYGLAEMYHQHARGGLVHLEAILLPVMLILVGGIMATMIIAMFLPIITMIQKFGSG